MSDVAPEAAAGVADEAEQVSEQPPETVEEQVPDEIIRLLEEPEYEEEPEIDLTPVAEETFYEDEDVDAIKRKLAKAEKRNQFLEERQRADALKKARKEAERYYKYADLDSIQATSRRGFLKQAAAQHERIRAQVDKATEAERKALAEAQAKLEADGLADRRRQWGHAELGDEETARRQADRQRQVYSELANRSGFDRSVAARMSDPNDPVGAAFWGMTRGIKTRDEPEGVR